MRISLSDRPVAVAATAAEEGVDGDVRLARRCCPEAERGLVSDVGSWWAGGVSRSLGATLLPPRAVGRMCGVDETTEEGDTVLCGDICWMLSRSICSDCALSGVVALRDNTDKNPAMDSHSSSFVLAAPDVLSAFGMLAADMEDGDGVASNTGGGVFMFEKEEELAGAEPPTELDTALTDPYPCTDIDCGDTLILLSLAVAGVALGWYADVDCETDRAYWAAAALVRVVLDDRVGADMLFELLRMLDTGATDEDVGGLVK